MMKNIIILILIGLQLNITTAQNILTIRDDIEPEDRICFTLYTVHENILKMTAQFHPIKDYEPFSAILQVKNNGGWETMAESSIVYPGYTAHFRVEDWDDKQFKEYRVVHNNRAFYNGIIRFNKPEREITFECWPRNVDMYAPDSKPYNGWPVTFSQSDNFFIYAGYELPKLKISEADQVLTVMDNYTGEIVTSLRIKGKVHQPGVMLPGHYKIAVGEGKEQYIYDVKAKKNNTEILKISLTD